MNDELLRDYESYLVQNGLRVWSKEGREAKAMRARLAHDRARGLRPAPEGVVRLNGLFGLSDFVANAKAELAANAMICAVNQAAYLLHPQLDSQGMTFLRKGGFTEGLYAARTQARSQQAAANTPSCPSCRKPMVRRTARTGPHAGQAFWGCSGYPECKVIRPIE